MAAKRSPRFFDVLSEVAAEEAAFASLRDNASRDCMELTKSCVLVAPVTTLITSEAFEPCISSRASWANLFDRPAYHRASWATAACASS